MSYRFWDPLGFFEPKLIMLQHEPKFGTCFNQEIPPHVLPERVVEQNGNSNDVRILLYIPTPNNQSSTSVNKPPYHKRMNARKLMRKNKARFFHR